MCGIVLRIGTASSEDSKAYQEHIEWLGLIANNAARGPDFQGQKEVAVSSDKDIDVSITFVASTLHLRGPHPVPQPHVSDRNIFCWNGEVFEGLEFPIDGNDGEALFSGLDSLKTPEEIYSFISTIEGPYALVYYQIETRRVYFARDPLGRRSLLIHKPTIVRPSLLVSSVSAGTGSAYLFEEIDPRYIYTLDLSILESFEKDPACLNDTLTLIDRTSIPTSSTFATLARVNRSIPEDPQMLSLSDGLPDELTSAIDRFFEVLDQSVRIRVQNIPRSSTPNTPRVACLYSGGIDSTIIAFLASRHIPPDEPIDLLNVAFENPRKILLEKDSEQSERKNKKGKQQPLTLPPNGKNSNVYNVPDRLSGLEELEELRTLCPTRQWNFVEINVDYTESSQARSVVEDLMFPSRTVMDLSLAMALYFAARGVGTIRPTPGDDPQPYISPAKVLLNGLGSDELLGGYSRHRSTFLVKSWQGLIDDLQLELDRIPSRNLGRDDRVISCHGKETRHPFLSLSVVDFVANLPVHLKVDLRLETGLGDKLLLRLLSQKLGLELASRRKKRAMQFGTHSARMEMGTSGRDGDILLSAS